MSNLAREIAEAAAWLARQDISFGEVKIVLVVHDGKVVRVERTRTDKELPVVQPEGSS